MKYHDYSGNYYSTGYQLDRDLKEAVEAEKYRQKLTNKETSDADVISHVIAMRAKSALNTI